MARANRIRAKRNSRAVFPGSFDPLTNGHVDIVERALHVFDEVVVGVLHNPSKDSLFSIDERVEIIRQQFRTKKNRVTVTSFSGLLVEFVRAQKCNVVIRGLRAISDYDYEAQMALTNRKLDDSVETLFLMAREVNSYISSSVVKQVAKFGGEVSLMVPKVVERALADRNVLKKKRKA